MKDMIALELGVVRLLAAEARAAGRDPASDPIPGLRRDVLLTSTADEEAGGHHGAGWIVEHKPEWLRAAGAVNECGGVATTIGGRRLYPIQVAEKGFSVYRIHVRGTWGHGSMPREDNAAVLAAAAIARLATPGAGAPDPGHGTVHRCDRRCAGRARSRDAARACSPTILPRPRPRSPRPATRCTRGPCAPWSATRSARTSCTPASSTT